jgi:hypothetical protein
MWGPCVTEGRGTTKEPEGGNRSRVQPTPRGEAHFPQGILRLRAGLFCAFVPIMVIRGTTAEPTAPGGGPRPDGVRP